MAKKRIENTVKGHRRGSRYPEEVRTAALTMMLTSNNIRDVSRRLAAVAKKYSVPESTLRSWYRAATSEKETNTPAQAQNAQSDFAKARGECVREIVQQAAKGAVLTTRMMVQRVELGQERAKTREEVRDELLIMGPPVKGEDIEQAQQREELLFRLGLLNSMNDNVLDRYMRTLYEIGTADVKDGGAGGARYEDFLDKVTGDEF